MEAFEAYEKALDEGPDETTRIIASQNPNVAYLYAIMIDSAKPCETTRNGTLLDLEWSLMYAISVDRYARDDTRKAMCESPHYAFDYAILVDRKSHDDTRNSCCKDPYFAYSYALHIDKAPRDDTREAACQNPEWAYFYAYEVELLKIMKIMKFQNIQLLLDLNLGL